MKKINISEDKLKKALVEIFKEEIEAYEDPRRPFKPQADAKKAEMGVGDDGTLKHNVSTEFKDETRNANLYPGVNDRPI